MKVFRSAAGVIVEQQGRHYALPGYDWDDLFREEHVAALLAKRIEKLAPLDYAPAPLAPIVSQEIWAAGVTYIRSRGARMEESKDSGGGDFYARVYEADRPELFFKATPQRVVPPGGAVRIRADSKWNVPEPEFTLAINTHGTIFGYTCGNDMSSRDIEGENPLYLPQAKVYDGCAAIGPAVWLSEDPLPADTAIKIAISRGGQTVFSDTTTISRMKRTPHELAGWLYKELSFSAGCFMMTGTGIVPPNDFTLAKGDRIDITIDCVGTLSNTVA